MKITFLPALLLLTILLPGCSLFREAGPPPVDPPYILPEPAGKKLTPELLREKMVDKLSMGIVANGLTGRSIRKVEVTGGNREMELLASVAERLAATGLIVLSTSPKDPCFISRTTSKEWLVIIRETFPQRILLQEKISLAQ